MLKPAYPIATERLLLRPFAAGDLDALVPIHGRADAVRYLYWELGLHRIIGRLDGRNTASARLLERLGMLREAQLVENELIKGEWTDEVIYALLDREWRAGGGRLRRAAGA